MLFDLKKDPLQLEPIHDEVKEQEMTEALKKEMQIIDAPEEQYERLSI